MVQIGDRVKLNADIAKRMDKKKPRNKSQKINWTKREGTVTRKALFTKNLSIRWDGRDSSEDWPDRAITVIGLV